jgi:hypothetical protein
MSPLIRSHTRRTRAAPAIGVMLLVILAASQPSAVGAHPANERAPVADTARTVNATDTAHLHYLRSSGSLLFEEGVADGTLPGNMRAQFNIGATVTASFTIYTRGGTLIGNGSAAPHGSGVYESFGGSLLVTGGTGRYAHAHGRAGLYGTFDRKTYALVVQTTGRLSY